MKYVRKKQNNLLWWWCVCHVVVAGGVGVRQLTQTQLNTPNFIQILINIATVSNTVLLL
jgi:hypothetical protein